MFLVDWPGGSWEATARLVAAILLLYIAALWLSVVFWTYRDIRQRSRDPIVQIVSLLLPFLFFLPGFWIYQLLRPRHTLAELYERSLEEEALLQDLEDQRSCPTCKRRVMDDFLICPSCRTHLKEPCRSCSKPLSYAWVACPFCGLEKPQRENYGPRPARQGQAPAPARPQQPQQARSVATSASTTPAPVPSRPPVAQATQRPVQPVAQPVVQPPPQRVANPGTRIPFGAPPPVTSPRQQADDTPVIDATGQ